MIRTGAMLFWSQYGVDPFAAMASDEWLLSRAESVPDVIVRLYTWSRPAITIGYHQDPARAVELAAIGTTPLIRRVTGGRALLHDQSELTYSMLVPHAAPRLAEQLSAAQTFAEATARLLQQFLVRLGFDTTIVRPVRRREEGLSGEQLKAPCMASVTRSELVSAGQKIVASAQRSIGGHFFQHGSIKWRGISAHPALSGVGAAISGKPVEREKFAAAAEVWVQTMRSTLGATVTPFRLTPADVEELNACRAERSAHPLGCSNFFAQSQPLTSL